jgi:hypothetical protein
MSLHIGSWWRGVEAWLSDQRPGSIGTAVRRKGKRRRRNLSTFVEALEPRRVPVLGLTAFAPGASGSDLGQPTQTITSCLEPYGPDGPACSTPPASWVEYVGGHTESGTAPANVGAMRAFFDFIIRAGIAHTPVFTNSSLLEVQP